MIDAAVTLVRHIARRAIESSRTEVLLLCALMLSVLWGGLWLYLGFERERVIAGAQDKNEALARIFEEHVVRTLRAADATLRQVETEYAQRGHELDLAAFLSVHRARGDPFSSIGIVDARGDLVLSSARLAGPLNLFETESVRFHRQNATGDLFISKPRVDTATGRWSVNLSHRIDNADGSYRGNSSLALDPFFFIQFYGDLKLGPGFLLSLIGRDGVVRARLAGEQSSAGEDLSTVPLFTKYLSSAGSGGFHEASPIDGTRRLYIYRTVRNHPLLVVVGTAETTAMASYVTLRCIFIAWAGVASVATVLITALTLLQISKQARIRVNLRQRETYLRTILQAEPECVMVISADGHIDDINPAGLALLEVDCLDSLRGTRFDAFVLPAHMEAYRAYCARAYAGEQTILAFELMSRKGARRWVEMHAAPLAAEDDSGARLVSVTRDITERKLADDALRASEVRLSDAQRVAQIGNWELDLRDNSLFWSDEIFRIFEIDKASFVPTYERFLGAVHPEDRELVNETYMNSLRTREPYAITHRLRMADGRTKYVQERCETQYDDQGRPLRSVGTVQDVSAAVAMAHELRTQKKFASAIIDHAGALVIVLDAQGRICRFNHACESLSGYRADEVMGACPWDVLRPPEDADAVRAHAFRALVENPHHVLGHFTNQWVAKTGERRLIEWTNTLLFDDHDRAEFIVSVGIDVTERKHAEEALRQVNEQLEARVALRTEELEAERNLVASILDVAGAVVLVMDRCGTIRRLNRACEELTGYREADLLGRPAWASLIPGERREQARREFELLLSGDDLRRAHEGDWLTRRGELRTIAWTGTTLKGADGQVAYVIVTGIDITDQRRAEAALAASEQLFRELAESIREVFFVRDLVRNRMIYISPAYEALWGRSREELYADPMAFLKSVHPDDKAKVVEGLQRQSEVQRYDFDMEYRIIDARGLTRWVWARTFPISNGAGRVTRVAGLVEDVTQRKRAEDERLLEAQQQREALVREVHHRIKNSLQGVAGLLRQHAAREPVLRSALDAAISQVHTMAIVHGLQSRDTEERIAFCDMIEAIVGAVSSITGRSMSFRIERGSFGPSVATQEEAVPLALIANELVMNAVKHCLPRDGDIEVVVSREDNAVVLAITNQNIDARPLRVDWVAGLGLGTGLQLVRSLMPGRGATFSITEEGKTVGVRLRLEPPIIVVSKQAHEAA